MVISQGRLNNAVQALSVWHQAALGTAAGYNDRVVFCAHTRVVLEADDRFLVGQTAPKADPDRLRLKIAKLRIQLDAMKATMRDKVRDAEHAKRAANERERAAAERTAEADRMVEQAKAWRHSADAYVRQANILRQQLLDAGIEPDPRCT